MTISPHVQIRLSIWREYSHHRQLLVAPRDRGSSRLGLGAASDFSFQEELYSWHLREDPFAGIEDEDVRGRLQEKLHELTVVKQPSERPLAVLDAFVTAAEEVIASGKTELAPIMNPPHDDENDPQKFNVLLAFVRHLKWLSRCFANRPGISVSIR